MRTSLFLAFAFVLLAGCKKSTAATTSDPELPPLSAGNTATLAVSGFGDAVVSPPGGATKPMPVLVAVLGIGDTAEEQCTAWRDLVGVKAFVLCPRGQANMVPDEPPPTTETSAGGGEGEPVDDDETAEKAPPARDAGKMHQAGYYPVDVTTLEKEIEAGLASLKSRYAKYVDDRDIVYVGFSRGAFLGASLVARAPKRFSRAVLIEGGQSAWRPESASAFAKGGGKRVLFACGQPSCMTEAETAANTLRSQKIETRVIQGAGEGHGYKKQVKEELRRSFAWVTEGDDRWRELIGR